MANRPVLTDEIEITPEMIEAGEEALWDADLGAPMGLSSVNTVENILKAALKAGGSSPRISSHHRSER